MVPGLKALCLLAALLVGVIVIELQPAGPDPALRLEAVGLELPRAAASPAVAADGIGAWREAALARPLFTPGRRPAAYSLPARALPRLSGIVWTPLLRLATFSPEPRSSHSMVCRVGDQVAGWAVARIEPSTVLLLRGRETVLLRPRYDTTQPSAPVAMVSIDKYVVLSTKRTNPQLAW